MFNVKAPMTYTLGFENRGPSSYNNAWATLANRTFVVKHRLSKLSILKPNLPKFWSDSHRHYMFVTFGEILAKFDLNLVNFDQI